MGIEDEVSRLRGEIEEMQYRLDNWDEIESQKRAKRAEIKEKERQRQQLEQEASELKEEKDRLSREIYLREHPEIARRESKRELGKDVLVSERLKASVSKYIQDEIAPGIRQRLGQTIRDLENKRENLLSSSYNVDLIKWETNHDDGTVRYRAKWRWVGSLRLKDVRFSFSSSSTRVSTSYGAGSECFYRSGSVSIETPNGQVGFSDSDISESVDIPNTFLSNLFPSTFEKLYANQPKVNREVYDAISTLHEISESIKRLQEHQLVLSGGQRELDREMVIQHSASYPEFVCSLLVRNGFERCDEHYNNSDFYLLNRMERNKVSSYRC